MRLRTKSLKNFNNVKIHLSLDKGDDRDMFYNVKEFGEISIHFTDDRGNHIEGYRLLGMSDRGLYRVKYVMNMRDFDEDDDYDDFMGDVIEDVEVTGDHNQLKIIGVDLI